MIKLAPKAVARHDKGTLALLIDGELPDQFKARLNQSIVVKIDESPLTECQLFSDASGRNLIALLPQKKAEELCVPGQASDIRIDDLGIKDAEIDWVSFPPKASGGTEVLSAPAQETIFSTSAPKTSSFSAEKSASVSLPSLEKTEAVALPAKEVAAKDTDKVSEGEKPSSRNKILLSGIIVLLLLLVAGSYGAYYFFSHRSIQQMAPENVVQAKVTPQQITQEGQRRLSAGQKDEGFRLIKYAALHKDPTALRLMGEMYDPASFKKEGPVLKADSDEAARYYQAAAQAGDQQVLPERSRLLDNLRDKARAGDQDAALTLKAYGT